jgi:hypothetical protein
MRSIETAAPIRSPRPRREPIHQPTLKGNCTMKRNLIAIVALGLGLGANAVLADNNWAFDDAYWKQAQGSTFVQSTQSIGTEGRYDVVDRYNP